MKLKTIYKCQNCQFESSKWVGKCPECEAWNSLHEETINVGKPEIIRSHQSLDNKPNYISSFDKEEKRVLTKITELDNVLGNGFKEGSLVLLSGEPGIGKSTLTMQICQKVAEQKAKVVYITGEESSEQVANRAVRLGVSNNNIQIISENNLENILDILKNFQPDFIIIDSIQVINSNQIDSLGGSINQIKFCTEEIMTVCKSKNITALIIGHVTKDGNIAGPRVLEHLVDVVLFLEGERYQQLRLLRALKNRYGSTNEIGLFEMNENGLNEIKNPSKIFLDGRKNHAVGSSITVNMEGNRPFLIEVQALTNTTVFGYPKRTTSGYDLNRLQLLAAVIQKHLKLNLNSHDIYLNVVGGFKLNEPANDLAVIMAIISSFKQIPLPENTVFIGEVGLSGELRSVSHLKKRVTEAEKLGFNHIIIPSSKESNSLKSEKIQTVEDLEKAFKLLN